MTMVDCWLYNVQAQIRYKMTLDYYGFGGGLPITLTRSNPSITFFRLDQPSTYTIFEGRASLASAEMVIGYGGGLCYLTFWGVDHDPYWLDLGGASLGISGGVTAAPIVGVQIWPEPEVLISGIKSRGTEAMG